MPGILFLTQRIPYPPTKGEKIRAFQILKYLSLSHDIYLGCLIDDPQDLKHVSAVNALCAHSFFATLDRRRARISCLRGLLTGEPLSVCFYRNRGLARWVAQVLRELAPEVIFVSSSNMAPYVLGLQSRIPVFVVDMVDVDSEKWRAYSKRGPLLLRLVHEREWRRVSKLEARIGHACDWVTFVSPEEAALFARQHPEVSPKIRAISNGVDHIFFDPAHRFEAPYETDHHNFVFTGTMDYPPNIDAATWFARTILPLIHRNDPDARFHIVGANPAAGVRQLTATKGVFVTGAVRDVRPYVAFAAACVAPLRIARGIQNKVLEAMAMARTVVVTPEALEGIAALPEREVLLAETPEAFAAACLYAASAGSLAIGQAARRRIISDYNWAERLRGFDPLLRRPRGGAEELTPSGDQVPYEADTTG